MKDKIVTRAKKMISLSIDYFKSPYYEGFAAQVAFYLFLSILPIIGLILQILNYFNIPHEIVRNMISSNMDASLSKFILELIDNSTSSGISFVMLILTIWSGSQAHFAMARIANYTLSGRRSSGSFLRERIRSLGTIIITLFTVVFSLIVMVYGEKILNLAFSNFASYESVSTIWSILKWPLSFMLYFFMLAYNYYVLPSERLEFKQIIPGTIVASIGILLVSFLYSAYINNISNQSLLYGSLATIVTLLIWFYFVAWVIWIGILFNKCWMETSEKDDDDEERTHIEDIEDEVDDYDEE